jgi:hypothetical protein
MKGILVIAILMLGLLFGVAQAVQITQYNQTWGDIDNNAANPWTSIVSGNNYVWANNAGRSVLVVNTTVTSSSLWGINLTIKKGFGFRSSIGNLLFTLSRNQTYIIGPFEKARFEQLNGTLQFYSNATRTKAFLVSIPV